jgi:chorismate-pyruvate lyase
MRLIALAALALAGCTNPQLPRFQAVLAANDSATSALGQWCAAQGIADPPTIRAVADRTANAPPSAQVRATLNVGSQEAVGYRHVRLVCGKTVLSVAHNWYVPERLEPHMNHTLETTDTPFGSVVAPLKFHRERLAEKRGAMDECPPGTVLSHRALLRLPDGNPISLVVECYTRSNLVK